MRCCLADVARALTFVSLALLTSQSFLLANAQSSTASNSVTLPGDQQVGEGSSTSSLPEPTIIDSTTTQQVVSTTTTSVHSTTTPPSLTTKPTTTTQAQPPPTSTKSVQTTHSSSNTPVPAAIQSSTTSSSAQESTTDTSSTSPSTSSSSISSGTSLSSVTSATSTSVTLVPNTGTTRIVPTSTRNEGGTADTTSYGWLSSSTASATGAADGVSASSKSFFDNKGAVAGTFTVVGVAVIGAIFVAYMYAKRRAARLQDEEDMTYFEKYTGNNSSNPNVPPSPTDMSFIGGPETLHNEPMASHAATDAYPDRSTHFGLPTMEEYAQPHTMGLNFNAGLEYPPNATYDPTQYSGYDGGYGTQQDGYSNPEAYYEGTRRSPSSPAHPYADPSNAARAVGAPRVQQQHYHPGEVVYHGEAQ